MTNPPEGSRPEGQPYGRPAYGQQPYWGPPQYGQSPQYGRYAPQPYGPYIPGYTAPPKKSRSGLVLGLVVLALAVVAAAVLVPRALSYQVLDPRAVQRDVAAQYEQRDGVKISLTCPQRMKVANGATYRCTGTTAQGDKVTVEIRIVDQDTASYTWSEG